jgi:hypothetical protein
MTDPEGFLDENGNLLPWQDEEDPDEDLDEENIVPVAERGQPAILPVSLSFLVSCTDPVSQLIKAQRWLDPGLNNRRRFPSREQQVDPRGPDPSETLDTIDAIEQYNQMYARIWQPHPRRA